MGNIKVKCSDNYGYGPVNAADAYIDRNKTRIFNLPKVKSWTLSSGSETLSKGFGVIGELENPIDDSGSNKTHIEFHASFLLSQITGVSDIIEKVFVLDTSSGLITSDGDEIFKLGTEENYEKIVGRNPASAGTAVDTVYALANIEALDQMNLINSNGDDWDLTLKFDLGNIFGLETSTTKLNYVDSAFANTSVLGAPIPNGSGGQMIQSTIDSIANYLPGAFGESDVWSNGSVTTFYSTGFSLQGSLGEANDVANSEIQSMFEKQDEKLQELFQLIGGEEEKK